MNSTELREWIMALPLHVWSPGGRSDALARVAAERLRAALAQPTAEPPAPFGWVRIAETGKESLEPLFVQGSRPPPYPARYRPVYAAAPALLPAPADERAAFENWARSEWGDRAIPDNAWLGWQARAALGATCPASPERSK